VEVILHPGPLDVELVISNACPDADFRDDKVGPLKAKYLDDALIGAFYTFTICTMEQALLNRLGYGVGVKTGT
jgi:hypothetical protein